MEKHLGATEGVYFGDRVCIIHVLYDVRFPFESRRRRFFVHETLVRIPLFMCINAQQNLNTAFKKRQVAQTISDIFLNTIPGIQLPLL